MNIYAAILKLNPKLSKSISSFVVGLLAVYHPMDGGLLKFPMDNAHAAIAPLADVGVREFLVKDGSQLLRLSLPCGEGMLMGAAASKDLGKLAQESIELVRLRLEQVGFANNAVWTPALVDLTAAQNIVDKNEDFFIDTAFNKDKAKSILNDELRPAFNQLGNALKYKDIENTLKYQEEAAQQLENLRSLQIPSKKLPYTIPEEVFDTINLFFSSIEYLLYSIIVSPD
jgi:hypothetical protein